MAGGLEADIDLADAQRLVPGQRLLRPAGAVLAEAGAHQGQRVGAGEHRAVAGAGVVGMGMGDHGAVRLGAPGR